MREWLSPTHPVWTLIDIVDRHLDTSVFHAGRRTGGVGRAGYNPDMLLTLLIWAWSKGMRSSRQIESACTDVVSYRVICAGDAPDHATISRFRKDNHGACEELFTQVLTVAARVGLGSLGTIALDGVKIASNASINANRSAEGLRAAADAEAAQARARRIAAAAVQAHADVDAAEDELYGEDDPGPGQVPEELADPTSRAKRIAEALAQIKAEEQARESARNAAAEGHLEQLDAGRFPVGRVPVAARVDAARTRLAREIARREVVETRYRQRAAAAAASGGKAKGKVPVPAEEHHRVVAARSAVAKATAEQAAREHKTPPVLRRNITDPQSRMQPLRGGGWVQGYNCQAFTAEDGIIIATGVGTSSADVTYYQQMVRKAVDAATLIAENAPPQAPAPSIGIMLFDAGYCSIDNLDAPGPDRLIATGKSRDLEAAATAAPSSDHAPAPGNSITRMAERLATAEGIDTYRKRSHIAETPFGHAKHNLGFRRFTSRGLDRATSEWSFHAAVHNISKILTHLAAAPTAALA
ncbi:transposase [Rhodococcus sovatensis]|uniref:Transposase n=2 Tax=Rhodococcus sovatensis TaxID=1805840 RepID=A0ABZ2PZ91_9NOCA